MVEPSKVVCVKSGGVMWIGGSSFKGVGSFTYKTTTMFDLDGFEFIRVLAATQLMLGERPLLMI